jgi:hypothetical protein
MLWWRRTNNGSCGNQQHVNVWEGQTIYLAPSTSSGMERNPVSESYRRSIAVRLQQMQGAPCIAMLGFPATMAHHSLSSFLIVD